MLRTLSRVLKAIPVAIEIADLVRDEIEDLAELRTRMARKAMSGDLDDSLARLLELKK